MLKFTYEPPLSTRVPGLFHNVHRPVSSMHERQHATQTTKRTSELLHKRICTTGHAPAIPQPAAAQPTICHAAAGVHRERQTEELARL